MEQPSAEFALAAACCRWPPSTGRDEAVASLARKVEWPLFLRLIARHRIEGLAWNALRGAGVTPPHDVAKVLADAATAVARENLRQAAESMRLKKEFDGAGVPVLFLKGLSLGAIAYGNIALKAGWDIDILVPLPKVSQAATLLRAAGYNPIVPQGADATRLSKWHSHAKESVWKNAARGMYVELHTALADNSMLLGEVGMNSPIQNVEITSGIVLPTLETEELFAYLCVHGASSAWFRLKWLADLAALLSPFGPAAVTRFYRRSQELGAGRSAALALLLCHSILELELPEDLRRELTSDRMNRWLHVLSQRKLMGRGGAVELDKVVLGTATIHLLQFGLLPGWRYKVSEGAHQMRGLASRAAAAVRKALPFAKR